VKTPGNQGDEGPARPLATILVVNDDAPTRYLIGRTLRIAGYHVVEASSGQEALKLASGRPDLLLLDVQLPDVDGYEVCRRLRAHEETRDLLIAHLSSDTVTREDRIRGLTQGADAYWTTPFEPEELLANIHALLRLQERARGAVRARDEFLAVAAHELRTPMTVLRLHLERILYLITRNAAETLSKSTVEKSLTPAVRQLIRLQQLLDMLLDVSRVAGDRLKLEVGTVEVGELTCEVAGRLQAQAQHLGVELRLELPAEPIVIVGDRLRLEQVLNNLLTNAIKYGERKPVLVRVEERADDVALTVRDQGIGIAPEDQGRIFLRFERATQARQSDSLGLGLYIAREIVMAHGGVLTVESVPGQGATFQALLPLRRTERY
jgi:signal transduction histidine kinase